MNLQVQRGLADWCTGKNLLVAKENDRQTQHQGSHLLGSTFLQLKHPRPAPEYYEHTASTAAVGTVKGGAFSENQFPFHLLFSNCSAAPAKRQVTRFRCADVLWQRRGFQTQWQQHCSHRHLKRNQVTILLIFGFLWKRIKTKMNPLICNREPAETVKAEKMP